MTQRTALILAVGLTAFVLVVGGGVAGRLAQPAAVAAAQPTDLPTPTQDPEVLLQQREAAYQALIDEANRRLQESYQKQQALADQLNATPTPTPTKVPVARTYAPPPAPVYAITPEMAATLALNVAPGATLQRPPELVNFQGIVAYEVVTDRGNVYVEANSGQILYNGTTVAAAAASAPPAAPPSGETESHDDHDEHESGD